MEEKQKFCSVNWSKECPEIAKKRYDFLYNKFKNEFSKYLIMYLPNKGFWLEVDSPYERSLLLTKYNFKEVSYEEVMKAIL